MKKVISIVLVVVILVTAVVVALPFTKAYWAEYTIDVIGNGSQQLTTVIPVFHQKDETVLATADQLISVADDFYYENGYINKKDESPVLEIDSTGYKSVDYILKDETS